MHISYLYCLTFVLVCISCATEPVDIPKTGEVLEGELKEKTLLDFSYGDDAQQVYDLYLPASRNTEDTDVIVLIHGGGWIEGDKEDMTGYVSLIQQNFPDHAIVNLNYRLAQFPNVKAFPNQFQDIDAALNSLVENKEEFEISPRFLMIGVSAGAHLALYHDSVYDTSNKVKGVCSIVGPTNLDDDFYRSSPYFSLAIPALIDESFYADASNNVQAVSPAYKVNSQTSPTLLFYGKSDNLVPVSNAYLLQEKLEAFNIPNQLTIYDGGHGDFDADSQQDLLKKLLDFITKYL